MKHNNIVPNGHFKKDWQNRVKTWLNQPGRKQRRRKNRQAKAAKVFPRPVSGLLRPVVHSPTVKYNMKTRYGRGFTLDELKEAGVNKHLALTIGIAVDHRRKNRSDESFQANVLRLKTYKSKLVLFPRNSKSKVKPGETEWSQIQSSEQQSGDLLPINTKLSAPTPRAITAEDRKQSAFGTLRKARSDARLVGIRQKKKHEREEAKKNPLLAKK